MRISSSYMGILAIVLFFLLGELRASVFSVGCGVIDSDGIYEIKDLAQPYAPVLRC